MSEKKPLKQNKLTSHQDCPRCWGEGYTIVLVKYPHETFRKAEKRICLHCNGSGHL